MLPTVSKASTIGALRSLSRKRTREEHCELCGALVAGAHPHLLESATATIRCSCDACAILFSYREEASRFVRIPRDIRRLDTFKISDGEWSAMLLPIDMAFFVHSTPAGRMLAYYPSPGGCTESLLSLEAWRDIAANNPQLDRLSPDVEALLVNRTRGRRDYYIAPLDECYRLTGLIRMHWQGLSGGDEVWRVIDEFFEALSSRAVVVKETAHA